MIEFVVRKGQFTAAELIGRIVLKDAGHMWPAMGSAGRVISASGSKLLLERIKLRWNSENGAFEVDMRKDHLEDVDQQLMMLSSVKAVCDTKQEALFFKIANENAHAAYLAVDKEVQSILLASEGLEISDLPDTFHVASP